MIIGVGVDHDHEGLADSMENDLTKSVGVKKGIIYTAIQKKDLEEYKKLLREQF